MRWTPTIAADKLKPGEDNRELLKSVGLYKVQGDAVFAVMGGISYQFVRSFSLSFVLGVFLADPLPFRNAFISAYLPRCFVVLMSRHLTQGGSVSHRVFHTRLLPNLLTLTPDGLPEIFHADAREACERMGGENGQLLIDTSTPQAQAQAAS